MIFIQGHITYCFTVTFVQGLAICRDSCVANQVKVVKKNFLKIIFLKTKYCHNRKFTYYFSMILVDFIALRIRVANKSRIFWIRIRNTGCRFWKRSHCSCIVLKGAHKKRFLMIFCSESSGSGGTQQFGRGLHRSYIILENRQLEPYSLTLPPIDNIREKIA